jgi:hypothetical protein
MGLHIQEQHAHDHHRRTRLIFQTYTDGMSHKLRYARSVNKTRLRQYVSKARQIIEVAQLERVKYKPGFGDFQIDGILPSVKGCCDEEGFIAHLWEVSRHDIARPYDFNRSQLWAEAGRLSKSKDLIRTLLPYEGSVMVQPEGILAIITSFDHNNERITALRGIDCSALAFKLTKNPFMERNLIEYLHGPTAFVVKMTDALTYP